MSRRVWLFVVLAFSFALVPAGLAQEKFYRPELDAKYLEGSLRVDWYGVYQKGKKIGYVRNERKRDGDQFVEEQLMSMKLVSFGQKIEISTAQTMVFKPAPSYRMVKTVLIEKAGPMAKKTTFTFSWSADGGKTWSAGTTTGYASLDVPALPPGTYLFRVFATVGKIPGEPTQSVSLTIH